MSKPQNPYVDGPLKVDAYAEMGWDEGFAAGIQWAKVTVEVMQMEEGGPHIAFFDKTEGKR